MKKALLMDFIHKHAFIRKPVILSSGRRSDYYIDCKLVLTHPVGMRLVCDLMDEELKKRNIEVVGGVELGAVPLLGALTYRGYHTFIIRKESKNHGLRKLIEGKILKTDKRVAVIDDVITTGASLSHSITKLKSEYPHIEEIICFCIFNREEGGEGINSLITSTEFKEYLKRLN